MWRQRLRGVICSHGFSRWLKLYQMKKRYFFLFFLLLTILFRASIFRASVNYEPLGERNFTPLQTSPLTDTIDAWKLNHPDAAPEEWVEYALKLTASTASFGIDESTGNPEQILAGRKANCVGYSRLFAAIIHRLDGGSQWLRQKILIGKISLFGWDLHEFSNDPFWSNHDYNWLSDDHGERLYLVDPTLYDYTRIKYLE